MKHIETDLDDSFAVLSDVHSNNAALDAVLTDIPDDITDYVFLGDVIGYAANPRTCLERIRDIATVVVMGNHDRSVNTPEQYSHNQMAQAGLEHARKLLSGDQRDWVTTRPERVIVNDRFLFAHSHPDPSHNDEYVRPRSFADMVPYLDTYDVDLIGLGHTHVQHTMDATPYVNDAHSNKYVMNPGSVGQPRDSSPRAAYSIVTTEPDLDVTTHRVAYDISRAQHDIRDAGLPERTATRLS